MSNQLFTLNDFEDSDGKKDKYFFEANIPVKMKIIETKEGTLQSSGFPYYVLVCQVLTGENAGKDYDLFINTKATNKDGETYVLRGFKKVLQGLCKEYAVKEVEEGRGNDLPESFKTQLSSVVGAEVKIAFFEPERGYQNLIYVSNTSKEVVNETKTETKEDNSF